MDAEHGRGTALVAVAVLQHLGEQRNLELAQRDLVQVLGAGAVEVAQVATDGVGNVVAQRHARSVGFVGSCVQMTSPDMIPVWSPAGAARSASDGMASLARRRRDKQRDRCPQRKSKVNATILGAGSMTSSCTAALWPGASSSALSRSRYSAGTKARCPTWRPSISDRVSTIVGHGWGQRASLRKLALTVSTPGMPA